MPQSCPHCKAWLPTVVEVFCPRCGANLSDPPKKTVEVPDEPASAEEVIAVGVAFSGIIAILVYVFIDTFGEMDTAFSVVIAATIVFCGAIICWAIRQYLKGQPLYARNINF